MSPGQWLGLLTALGALAAALVLVPVFRRLALRAGVVDKPGGRKTQRAPVPLLGGVAVALSALLAGGVAAACYGAPLEFAALRPAFLAGGLIFAIGLVDDVFKDRITALPKFLGQLAAVAVLFGDSFGALVHGDLDPGRVFHLFASTLWFLTVVNAVNFVDNMNGLCPGLSMISLLVGLFGVGGVDPRAALVAGALGGALLGFLPYNFPRARVYLGDAGSHLAGFFLALLSLQFTAGFLGKDARLFGLDAFVPAMLILGVPLFDLLFSVVRRHRERRPLFLGDARHLSHRLVGAGLDATSAVMLLWGVQLILAAAGVVALAGGPGTRYAITAVILAFLGVLAAILVRVEARRRV